MRGLCAMTSYEILARGYFSGLALVARTEWLPDVCLRHFSTTCAVHMKEKAGGCPVVIAQ